MKKGLAVLTAAACFLAGCAGKPAEPQPEAEPDLIQEGTVLLKRGGQEEAIRLFLEAAEEGDRTAEAYRGIGLAYFELRDYSSCREYLQKTLEAGGEETPILYNIMGICAMNLGDYDTALADFDSGIGLYREGQSQGDTGAETEQEEGAAQTDGETVDYAAVVQEMRFNRIVCFEKKRDWESAKAEAAEYLNDHPDDKEAQKEAQFLETR